MGTSSRGEARLAEGGRGDRNCFVRRAIGGEPTTVLVSAVVGEPPSARSKCASVPSLPSSGSSPRGRTSTRDDGKTSSRTTRFRRAWNGPSQLTVAGEVKFAAPLCVAHCRSNAAPLLRPAQPGRLFRGGRDNKVTKPIGPSRTQVVVCNQL